jgi:hypothetical protein
VSKTCVQNPRPLCQCRLMCPTVWTAPLRTKTAEVCPPFPSLTPVCFSLPRLRPTHLLWSLCLWYILKLIPQHRRSSIGTPPRSLAPKCVPRPCCRVSREAPPSLHFASASLLVDTGACLSFSATTAVAAKPPPPPRWLAAYPLPFLAFPNTLTLQVSLLVDMSASSSLRATTARFS